MKVSLKLGAIKVTTSCPAYKVARVIQNGKIVEEDSIPQKSADFSMEETSIEFECEVGELAEVYKAYAPMLKDMIEGFVEVKKAMIIAKK